MAAEVEIKVKATDEATGVFSKIGSAFGGMMQTAGGFLMANVIQKGVAAATDFVSSSIAAASNLEETYNKVNEIFEESSGAVVDWAKNAATNVGLSSQQALDGASTMAVFGKAAGLAGAELQTFAQDNVQLAADLASFFNSSVPEAVEALGAAFRGESEPLRRYGVLLSDDLMRAKALEMGIISTTKQALTPQQKTLAAHALIMEQTADAQGDFARTADGLANSQRIFTAQIENAKTQLGTAFLPMVTKVFAFLNSEGIPILLNVVDKVKALVGVFETMGGNLMAGGSLKGLFSTFEDGSSYIGSMFKALGMGEEQAYALGDALNTSLEPVISMVTQIGDSFRMLFDSLRIWWTVNGAPIMASFQQMGTSVGDMFQKIVADVGPLVNEVLAKISVWMLENGPLIQATIQVIADAFTNYLVPAVLVVWNTIQPIIGGLVDLILGAVRIIMQVITGDWQGAWNTLLTTAQNVGNALVEAVTNLLYGIVELFGGNLDEILDSVAKWVVSMVLKFRELRDKIVEGVQDFVAAGRGIVDGIREGIMDGWDALVGWFEDRLAGLASMAQNVLGVHSPSTVFAEIGKNIMAGMAVGIQDGAGMPATAITDAIPGVTGAAMGVPVGGATGGGIIVNVNISSPMTFLDEQNAVQNIRKYVQIAVRSLRAEGAI